MTTKLLLASALIALLVLPAGAQQAPQGTPTRIRGTVEKLDGQALTVNSREGQTATIALADNVVVAYLVKKDVGDIKPGDYIASTGIKGTDGKLHAIEVRIFPESLRGAGEGQYPWDLKPDSVMTNATVGTITQAPQGNVTKVSYKGTESEYTVDPTTPIFANATGAMELRMAALGFGWAGVTATQVYTIFDIHPLLAEEFVCRGAIPGGFDLAFRASACAGPRFRG
jgi:hypothetical protein